MILKKLILSEWFKSFFTSFLVLICLVSVSHLISEFLRSSSVASKVLVEYIFQLPFLLHKVIPISCIFASLFSISRLINRNELVAIFATGYSWKKFLITIFQASTLVACFQFYNIGFLMPYSVLQKEILLDPGSKMLKGEGLRKIFLERGKFWYKRGDYFLSFSGFNQNSDTLREVSLLKYDKEFSLKEVIVAEKIQYRDNNNWLFSNVIIYSGLNGPDFPTIIPQNTILMNLHELPDDFKEIQANTTTLNFFDLGRYISLIKASEINSSVFEVLYLDMINSSLTCIIFALLACLPLFYPNRRGNPFGKYLIYVFVFTLVYWFAYSYSMELGKNSMINTYVSIFFLPASFLLFFGLFVYRHRNLTN